jgi:hypothetical protein
MAAITDAWLSGHSAPADGAQVALQRAEQRLAELAPQSLDDDDAAGCLALVAQLARVAGEPARGQSLREQALALRERVAQQRAPHLHPLLSLEAQARAHWPAP